MPQPTDTSATDPPSVTTETRHKRDSIKYHSKRLLEIRKKVMMSHIRRMHMGYYKMLQEAQQANVTGLNYTYEELKELGPFHCHICWLTKLTRHPRYHTISVRPLPPPGAEWCLDLKTRLPLTAGGETMVLCCVDRGSGASFYFPMKHKDEVRAKIKALDIIVRRSKLRISGMGVLTRDPKNLTGIASLQTDDEKIFTEGEVAKYCDKTGIDQRISPRMCTSPMV